MKRDKAAVAGKSRPEWRSCRETIEGRQGGSGSQGQPRMEIGNKLRGGRGSQEQAGRETNEGRRRQRAAQKGDHAGRQMQEDKAAAAAKSRPEWRSWRETNEGRQGGSSSQEQNGDHEGGEMKRDKAAAAAKSIPEWRSWREQPRMEIMKGDKWRATRRQQQPRAEWRWWRERMKRDKAAAAAKSSPEWRPWRETNEARQGGSGKLCRGTNEGRQGSSGSQEQNGDHEWRQMKGDKAAAASRPFGDFGDQQPSHWEVRTPIASSYLGKNEELLRVHPFLSWAPDASRASSSGRTWSRMPRQKNWGDRGKGQGNKTVPKVPMKRFQKYTFHEKILSKILVSPFCLKLWRSKLLRSREVFFVAADPLHKGKRPFHRFSSTM